MELQVRLVYPRNGKISSEYQKDTMTLCRNDRVMKLNSNPGNKMPSMQCNIDVTKGNVNIAGTKNLKPSVQEWRAEGAICLNHQIRKVKLIYLMKILLERTDETQYYHAGD